MENEELKQDMPLEEQAQEVADAGRATDTTLGHLTNGEIVIPVAFAQDPELIKMLQSYFAENQTDINEFTVGNEANKINPETGYPEFFKLGKLLKIAAPIALSFLAPGIGTALGSSILGAGAAGASTLGGGLLGAGLGLATGGGLKGALLGGITGGITPNIGDIGSYISKTGSGVLSDLGKTTGLTDVFSSATGALGDAYKGISDNVSKAYNGSAIQDVYKSGGEALKSLGLGGNSTPTVGSAGAGASAYGQPTDLTKGVTDVATDYKSPLASVLLGAYSNNKAEEALLKQQRANQALYAPYQNFSFNPTDLQNDPGYQFNLAQGNQAQDRAQLARGGYFSGNALKEAQTFGQGLADNTYSSAFQRALQTQNAGLNAANAAAGVNENIGNIKSNSAINTGNLYSGALGSILGGNSFDNTGALRGGSGNDWLTQYIKEQIRQQARF
jgi:hypothetical protein